MGTARRIVERAVDGVESLKETELRLLVIANGSPAPLAQHVVRTPGGSVVARLDLAWPEYRVGLESGLRQSRLIMP